MSRVLDAAGQRSRFRPRRRPALVATVLAFLTSAALAGPAVAAPAPLPGSLTDVRHSNGHVTALLTVPGAGGAAGIDTGSITARVNGVSAPVTVTPINQERRVSVLVVDTSGSMGTSGMATMSSAVNAFLSTVPSDVLVGLVSFSDAPRLVVAPTRDRQSVRTAVGHLKAGGETTLYDALLFALRQLGSGGERSLVLLSDGGDTRSQHSLAQATAGVAASGARAEVVAFKTDETQSAVLAGLATAGRGTVAAAGNPTAVNAAFTAAARILDSQVRLSVSDPAGVQGTQTLTVSALASGHPVQAASRVDFGVNTPDPVPAPSAPAPAAASVPKASSSIPVTLVLALCAVFLGLAGLVFALLAPSLQSARERRVRSIEDYVSGNHAPPGEAGKASSPSSLNDHIVGLADQMTAGRASTARTALLLERADLPFKPGEWAVLRGCAMVVVAAVAVMLFHSGFLTSVIAGIVGGLAGLFGPSAFLRLAAKRRARKFDQQLPDVLTLVASSLATGFSLLQALDAVTQDAAQPAAKEFARALAEARIGTDIDQTLQHVAERMGSENLRWTGMAVAIQRQVGGNLAETLRTTATTLREREALHRHVRALSAEGRLSAYILIALPVGMFLWMLKSNYAYVSLLWSSPIGWLMDGGSIIGLVIGVVWMRRVVQVEV